MNTPLAVYCATVVAICIVGIALSAIGVPFELRRRRALKEHEQLALAAAAVPDIVKRSLSAPVRNLRRRRAPHLTIEIREGGEVL